MTQVHGRAGLSCAALTPCMAAARACLVCLNQDIHSSIWTVPVPAALHRLCRKAGTGFGRCSSAGSELGCEEASTAVSHEVLGSARLQRAADCMQFSGCTQACPGKTAAARMCACRDTLRLLMCPGRPDAVHDSGGECLEKLRPHRTPSWWHAACTEGRAPGEEVLHCNWQTAAQAHPPAADTCIPDPA